MVPDAQKDRHSDCSASVSEIKTRERLKSPLLSFSAVGEVSPHAGDESCPAQADGYLEFHGASARSPQPRLYVEMFES